MTFHDTLRAKRRFAGSRPEQCLLLNYIRYDAMKIRWIAYFGCNSGIDFAPFWIFNRNATLYNEVPFRKINPKGIIGEGLIDRLLAERHSLQQTERIAREIEEKFLLFGSLMRRYLGEDPVLAQRCRTGNEQGFVVIPA